MKFLILFYYFLGSMYVFAAPDPNKATAILVDKSRNQLHLVYYHPEKYETIKTFRTTFGQVKGAKIAEGDLKTPEGVFFFKSLILPPALKRKFGAMAFYVNYPNAFDRLARRTGYDILLHSTDEPERLVRDLDSEGCVVVNDEEITFIRPYIRLNLTPFLIFDQLDPQYLNPSGDPKLKTFFESWVDAWENKKIDSYINSYHSAFTYQGRTLAQYRAHKDQLNKQYKNIEVKPDKVMYFRHPQYNVVIFIQNYRSILQNGQAGHTSRGTKILHIAEEGGEYKIIDEDYTLMTW